MNKIIIELHSKDEAKTLIRAIKQASLPDKRKLQNLCENLNDLIE